MFREGTTMGNRVGGAVVIFLCALSPATAAPRDDVLAAFHRYDDGWRHNNADEILATMAPDVEWTNSVGLRFVGKEKLGRFLTHLFKDANYLSGQPGSTTITSTRMFGTVAVVSSAQVTLGQKDYKTGKPVPAQHTNEMTVFERQGGTWLIVMDLTSDEANGI
jgi:uncharacterized protein (TIGR02246 family)